MTLPLASFRFSNEALRLLRNDVPALFKTRDISEPALPGTSLSTQFCDPRRAGTIGATRDGSVAAGRGLRAARLRAIKSYILANLSDPLLSVGDVALNEHVTPRYVHKLFEVEGTTFSGYVLGELFEARTHQMLSDTRCSGMTITAIAFAAGFGDLSYFYRTFHRRFRATSSDVRHNIPPV